MEAHELSAEQVLKNLGTDRELGLSRTQAEASREKHGANRLTKQKGKSLLKRIAEGLTEPMMIILLIAFAITIGVNTIGAIRGKSFDVIECVGIAIAITLSVAITVIMEGRSAKAFEALADIGGKTEVKAVRSGAPVMLKSDELAVGDIIMLGVGDKVPADARVIECKGLRVDESPLTGESNPIKKDAHYISTPGVKSALAERRNMVYSGCFVTEGTAVCVVTAVGDGAEIGLIARELNASEGEETPIQQKLSKLGKLIAVIGSLCAAAVMIVQLVKLFTNAADTVNFESISDIFITSIVLIVASVPEGLPTIVAISLALNVIKMARRSALVKKMVACETVGCISVICSDKTGTLTENKMTVKNVVRSGELLTPENIRDEFLLANFCINTTADVTLTDEGLYSFVGNPTECALLVANEKAGVAPYGAVRAAAVIRHVYPFSSEYKRMTTVISENGRQVVYSKGAPELILDMCEMNPRERKTALKEIAAYQSKAARIIAFAHGVTKEKDFENRRDAVEKGLIFDGYAVISDPVRKEVFASVEECRNAGIEVKMLTGDNAVTAEAIARELKLIDGEGQVFTAHDIEEMTDSELEKKLPKIKVVARSTPMTKLRIVKTLKKLGAVVAVTGDGINDAPAIKNADVGIAMGISGTEVSKEASDIVLLDDSFSTIAGAVRWGRGIYENFQRFILFQLTVNVAAVLLVVLSIIFDFEPPFNPLELLWINLIMDGPPALTLGLEGMHDDLMKRKPTDRNASIVTKKMLLRIITCGTYMAVVLLLQMAFNFMQIPGGAGAEKTFIFTTFVMFQLFNAFNARELGEKSIFTSLAKNKLMLIVFAVTMTLQIVITQFGTMVFNTVPLDIISWLKMFGLSFSIVALVELYRLIMFLYKKRRDGKTNKTLPESPESAVSRNS